MTLKNAVTKGVKAWRDRRVGYWLCIDPKTGEYYLLTSAALAELNGLKAMYRLPAVYYRVVLTRDWNVKLGPHVIGTHLDTSATASPSSIRPGFIWTKRSSARRNNRSKARSSVTSSRSV